MSEDYYTADAQFLVRVDRQQVGGTYTASALHSASDSNVFTLTGNWGAGSHDVQIQFLNDAYAGTPSTDRNLYVYSIGYDGASYSGSSLYSSGTFAVQTGGASTASPPTDTLTLHLSEDAYEGDAQFALTIDGKQIATPQAVTVLHNANAWQDFTFAGNFGAGNHTVGVTFTNDAWGGSASSDRNLYVNGIDINGTHFGKGAPSMLATTGSTAHYTVSTAQ